ncbi:hypothetical protein A2U01_0015055, partial [Trifolium medium]|nr:hypothetical protein [Trifolium medium]
LELDKNELPQAGEPDKDELPQAGEPDKNFGAHLDAGAANRIDTKCIDDDECSMMHDAWLCFECFGSILFGKQGFLFLQVMGYLASMPFRHPCGTQRLLMLCRVYLTNLKG